MPSDESLKLMELGGYKVKDNVWFLDKKGKCRWGIVLSLGTTPQDVPYASVHDQIDRRNITLTLEQLSSRPLDAPRARARSSAKKDRGSK